MNPEISVVIPVYNVERFLPTCIESLLQQTFQNIEYIFVNDASPDHCADLLHEQQKTHPEKIRLVNLEENRCQGGARNAGIACARGKYIGFVDGDDFVESHMYECLYNRIEETKADAVFSQYAPVPETAVLSQFDAPVKPLYVWNDKLLQLDNKKLQKESRTDFLAYTVGSVNCGLYRRELIIQNNVKFPEHLRYEDNYWIMMIKCYIQKVSFVQKICYYYRANPNSTTHSKDISYFFDRIKIENMLLAEVKKRGFYESHYNAWEYIYTFRYAINTYMGILRNFSSLPVEKLQEIVRDLREEFPRWYRNHYYQELTTTKQKLTDKMVVRFPVLFAYLYRIVDSNYKMLKRIVKKVIRIWH